MHLHTIARALGRRPGEGASSGCAVCGRSPFGTVGRLRPALGPAFNNHLALRAPDVDAVCEGCKAVLGGKPGRTPPPLRMRSIAVDPETDTLRYLEQKDWWEILTNGQHPPIILSWAHSRKKQHMLHAGISCRGYWHVGSDDGPIRYDHRADALDAILALREAGASKGAILAGRYRPQVVAACGALVERCETVLRPLRGLPAMALWVHAAPSDIEAQQEEEPRMLGEADRAAVTLLEAIAWGAEYRVKDGLRFWGGYFQARIARFARLPLPEAVSRLIGECRVSTTEAARAAAMVEAMSEEDMAAVEEVLRQRSALVHALAFDRMKVRRTERDLPT